MKVIVAGSRNFNNYEFLSGKLDHYFKNQTPTEIISGGARGADKFGEIYAKRNNISLKIFPADWETHGKAAGYIRNKQMAEYADACVVFWDGKSKGSKHMIDLAKKYNLKLRVVLCP